jgi:hypothetical protein
MTKTFARRTLLGFGAATLTGIAAAALAQPAWGPGEYGPGMMGWGRGYGPAMMGGGRGYGPPGPQGPAWRAEDLASLKSKLGITPAEEPAWDTYARTVSALGDQMRALRDTMWDTMGRGSWDDHRAFMERAFETRRQTYTTMRDATDKLLQALEPAQQDKARGLLPGSNRQYGAGYGSGPMMGGYGPGCLWR